MAEVASGPSLIQRRAPLTDMPMPGTSTSRQLIAAMRTAQSDRRSKQRRSAVGEPRVVEEADGNERREGRKREFELLDADDGPLPAAVRVDRLREGAGGRLHHDDAKAEEGKDAEEENFAGSEAVDRGFHPGSYRTWTAESVSWFSRFALQFREKGGDFEREAGKDLAPVERILFAKENRVLRFCVNRNRPSAGIDYPEETNASPKVLAALSFHFPGRVAVAEHFDGKIWHEGGNQLLQRSLTVASAIAASMAPMSQKRTTTWVSVQPLRWK